MVRLDRLTVATLLVLASAVPAGDREPGAQGLLTPQDLLSLHAIGR